MALKTAETGKPQMTPFERFVAALFKVPKAAIDEAEENRPKRRRAKVKV